MRVGLIARMDKSGLGVQTLRLSKLLKPNKILLIDSTPFNGAEQHPHWYNNFQDKEMSHGFPSNEQIYNFLSHLDVVISCETFYNNSFTRIAKERGVKTVLIANPEFMDWLKPEWEQVPSPDKVIVPSLWMMDKMKRFNPEYLPTPIFDEFKSVRKSNLKRTGKRYLFINGKTAAHDRNGLESLYEALPMCKGKFTITIKVQNDVKKHPDPRLIYDFTNPEDQSELYKDFDLLIQPRRYGGQTLSMCEALNCAIPILMTDVSPNNKVLPPEWLVPATKTGEFMTRTMIDIYSANPNVLAHKLDNFDITKDMKKQAYEIGKQYEAESLRSKYEELLNEVPS